MAQSATPRLERLKDGQTGPARASSSPRQPFDVHYRNIPDPARERDILFPMRTIFQFVLGVIASAAIIYFLGGVSLRASLAIAVLVNLVCYLSQPRPASSPTPYRVRISPRIGDMLFDLGLVSAEWKGPWPENGLPYYPWTPLHTYYHGINAVVLSSEPRLVHWTGPNWYTKRIEYSERLDFLKFPHPILKDLTDSDWSPEFFFRGGRDGYETGIRVLNHWWSDNKERLERTGIVKNIDDNDEADGGRTRVTLAVLPSKVFWPLDFRRQNEKAKKKLREEIKTELPLAGWKVEPPWSPWGQKEFGVSGEANYVCKYAEVSLWLLD